nr:pre-mRNA splicing Prp18-interacting factor [Tanacetum cinerariifolium]
MSSFNQRGCYGCRGLLDGFLCRRCTCEWCGNNLRDGFFSFFNSRAENSFIYDSNPNSFDNPPDFSYHPPQPQYETYSCELCGNDAHYGYDYPPQVPFIDSLLEEFSGELAHIDLISPEIKEANFDPEEEIRLVKKLLYDNSYPRPPKEFNSENSDAVIESLSLSPIPVEGSDSLMEEIDICLALNDSMSPGFKNDDYDSEGNILFLEELLNEDSFSLPENESFQFDHYFDPSSPRPPTKPPDDDGIYFDDEPDTRLLTAKV